MDFELSKIRQKLFDIDMNIELEKDLKKRNEFKKLKKQIYSEYKNVLLNSINIRGKEEVIYDKYKGR